MRNGPDQIFLPSTNFLLQLLLTKSNQNLECTECIDPDPTQRKVKSGPEGSRKITNAKGSLNTSGIDSTDGN